MAAADGRGEAEEPAAGESGETKALAPADVAEVVVDTTVMPKNVMLPTDAKLMNRAREKLVKLAKESGIDLRQSYARVGKYALIKHQRYAHAKQLPYEFGVKVSVATTLKHAKGGQFALHAMALPGNPYDGHTLKAVIHDMQALIGNDIKRILTDAGYRGHHAPETHKLRVFTQGQKRGVPDAVRKMMKRRAAIEPVIGHIKHEHRMGPQLPRTHHRRRHQRHPRRLRLQLPPPPQLAEGFFVPLVDAALWSRENCSGSKTGFFSVDHLAHHES